MVPGMMPGMMPGAILSPGVSPGNPQQQAQLLQQQQLFQLQMQNALMMSPMGAFGSPLGGPGIISPGFGMGMASSPLVSPLRFGGGVPEMQSPLLQAAMMQGMGAAQPSISTRAVSPTRPSTVSPSLASLDLQIAALQAQRAATLREGGAHEAEHS
jgi:hypothetical protein